MIKVANNWLSKYLIHGISCQRAKVDSIKIGLFPKAHCICIISRGRGRGIGEGLSFRKLPDDLKSNIPLAMVCVHRVASENGAI